MRHLESRHINGWYVYKTVLYGLCTYILGIYQCFVYWKGLEPHRTELPLQQKWRVWSFYFLFSLILSCPHSTPPPLAALPPQEGLANHSPTIPGKHFPLLCISPTNLTPGTAPEPSCLLLLLAGSVSTSDPTSGLCCKLRGSRSSFVPSEEPMASSTGPRRQDPFYLVGRDLGAHSYTLMVALTAQDAISSHLGVLT